MFVKVSITQMDCGAFYMQAVGGVERTTESKEKRMVVDGLIPDPTVNNVILISKALNQSIFKNRFVIDFFF